MKVCVDCGDNHENEYEHCDNCIEMYEQTNDNQATELETLRRQVEEMQKTLEFYGNADNWELPSFGQGHSTVVSDHGERARQALKGVKTK